MTIEELKELVDVLGKLKQDNLDIEIEINIKSKNTPQIYTPDWGSTHWGNGVRYYTDGIPNTYPGVTCSTAKGEITINKHTCECGKCKSAD